VILPPEGSEFRSWYPPEVEAGLAEFLERVRREFGVVTVDARGWLSDEAFADSHHVTRSWAGVYTGRLVKEVIVPALEGP